MSNVAAPPRDIKLGCDEKYAKASKPDPGDAAKLARATVAFAVSFSSPISIMLNIRAANADRAWQWAKSFFSCSPDASRPSTTIRARLPALPPYARGRTGVLVRRSSARPPAKPSACKPSPSPTSVRRPYLSTASTSATNRTVYGPMRKTWRCCTAMSIMGKVSMPWPGGGAYLQALVLQIDKIRLLAECADHHGTAPPLHGVVLILEVPVASAYSTEPPKIKSILEKSNRCDAAKGAATAGMAVGRFVAVPHLLLAATEGQLPREALAQAFEVDEPPGPGLGHAPSVISAEAATDLVEVDVAGARARPVRRSAVREPWHVAQVLHQLEAAVEEGKCNIEVVGPRAAPLPEAAHRL
eukprot:CAMPEP_0170253636 /NCGR_PEP_ID=MMETSP0116_2-20130129/26660_1 /TAXON_ID=400756 /ORGANISM="Durinskia baltica, Strain CSIRO CS-38" /LENGTH=355 /DNA_ID=CAMNT_0010504623 /DNA_START=155 /DNA_END=1224 /DNA_ORIENTATION=+